MQVLGRDIYLISHEIFMASFSIPKAKKHRGDCSLIVRNRSGGDPSKSPATASPTSTTAYDLELATYHRHLQVQTASALMGQFYNGELATHHHHHHSAAALALRGGGGTNNGGVGGIIGGLSSSPGIKTVHHFLCWRADERTE